MIKMATNENIVTPVPGIENLTYEDVNTLLNSQRLWLDIVQWTRNFYHGAFQNLPDQSVAGNQLFVELPADLYNEFRKYYSEQVSQQFLNNISRMTAENWQLATAYKNKDKTAIDLSTAQWYQIADELAEFLAETNKYLDEAQLKTLLYEYINLKIKEITTLISGNYELEAKIYSDIEDVIVRMAIYAAMGIIAARHAAQHSAYFVSRL